MANFSAQDDSLRGGAFNMDKQQLKPKAKFKKAHLDK